MKTKSILIAILFQVFLSSALSAQEKIVNVYDSAYTYFKKRDFKKSAAFYDTYYLVQKNTQSNYDTYRAAVASSYIGNMENAKYYIKSSAEIGYDYSGYYDYPSYDAFVNDTIHNHIRQLPEWKNFISVLKFKSDSAIIAINKITAALKDTVGRSNTAMLDNKPYWENIARKSGTKELISNIKNFSNYPKTSKSDYWTMYTIKVNDTLSVPFLVHIPKNYSSRKPAPLYVYLHGAIINRTSFANPAWIGLGNEVKIMEKAMEQDAFVLYPFGRKNFGWLYHQLAFETILNEIYMVKSRYNIDDNKVFIAGHSNGGSGAYWYAINQQTPFAAFLGLNYLPKAYFGNTSLLNMQNVTPFYGISGSEDTTFPLVTVNEMYQFARSNGANWTNYTRKGNHGLAVYQRDSINFIFDKFKEIKRNPFPKAIQWETADVRNGRNSWIEIMELDTIKATADWHTPLNPTITQKGKADVLNFNLRKSGAIKATADGNMINIQTSRVKRIKLYISADMFNLDNQLKINVNGKQYLNVKLDADKNIILSEFLKTKDRAFIVSNVIEFTVD